MKKQVTAIVVGAAFILATAATAFAQGNGNAVGGGAAGGPNGIYKDTTGGSNGNNTGSSGMGSGSSK